MQRNASRWLYGSVKADEAFYVRKNGLANLNKDDLIKIDGESEYRTINKLPRYFEPKTYIPGDDPSSSFFGSVATTNYNGEEEGVGFAATCTISGGSVDTITWGKDIPISGYDRAPILNFIPVDQAGGGARAEVIVDGGVVIDIVLTNGGSGYTKAPRVVVAKQYKIKKGNRKIDSFVNLILNNQFASVSQPGPVLVESFYSRIISPTGTGSGPGSAIVSSVLMPSTFPDLRSKITVIFDPITRSASSSASSTGTVQITWPTINQNAGTNLIKVFKEITHIQTGGSVKMRIPYIYIDANGNRRVGPPPGGGGGTPPGGGVGPGDPVVGKSTIYELGFVDHRYWNPAWNSSAPTHLNNMSLRPSFLMWGNAKFMDTGNISHNSVPVSALTIEEMSRWGYDLEDFADNAGSGVSDAGYVFNVGYPSINYYLGRINQNLNSSDTIVYAENTTDFPATGTLQLGKEQITYTGKQSDRFTGCTRGVNGTTAQSHDTSEPYFRSA